ncbi:MAG: integration host factor subunit alpha [Deltaproteobacteria bacterium]|nr:integration host factor subunit alpha [Deltaproteobacteria bacterium]MBW1736700.1 integration host factor subunit alpha [Deltaproteobacteria bacterium]MBW1907998.1 integration host factor subunit alpha [Deltaproteobacteria bacterium]MBW2033080.1 integration host factor subunit alpha [Deltaproteobacteria bacterium]MBW2114248.1 integration host factor subunit alpha [Deltaproteobacteria bacterium]
MALTKADLVENVAREGFTKKDSAKIVETLLELIKSTLKAGDEILISGFGKFCVKEKKQRRGRNPATGEDLILDARRVITFKCSPVLTDKINGKLSVPM